MFKVLIVEDEEIIRKGLIFMFDWLKANCIIVGEAENGEKGLEEIEKLKPDIVITDVKMPFKDGLEMLEESILDYDYKAIVISGYDEFEYAKKAISLGVEEYLLKPVDFQQLCEAIEKVIDKIESENEIRERLNLINIAETYKTILDIKYYDSIKSKTTYVTDMLRYIKNNYCKKISLKNLSKTYSISSSYLNLKFKEETNYTFNDFLNRYRILQSVILLRENTATIYEIAEKVGFQDYKYFSQVFKKYVGCSPTKFIEAIDKANM